MAVRVSPRAGLDVDVRADEAERGAPLVDLDERALGLLVEDGPPREFGERAELYEQRAGLGRVRLRAAHLSRLEVDEPVRDARGRVEDGQQPVPQILRQIQEPLVARELVGGEQAAEESDRKSERVRAAWANNHRSASAGVRTFDDILAADTSPLDVSLEKEPEVVEAVG